MNLKIVKNFKSNYIKILKKEKKKFLIRFFYANMCLNMGNMYGYFCKIHSSKLNPILAFGVVNDTSISQKSESLFEFTILIFPVNYVFF